VQRGPAQIRLLVASFAGLATGYSVFVGVVFGLFIEPLSSEFGWSRTAIAGALTLCSASIVLLAPVAGALLDRYGIRRILIPSIGLFGIAVAALSMLRDDLWMFYGVAFAIALAGIATLPATYSRMLVKAFTERRGLALSVALSGVGVAGIVLPFALERAISSYGWRTAYLRNRQAGSPLPTSEPGDGLAVGEQAIAPDLEINELRELDALVDVGRT